MELVYLCIGTGIGMGVASILNGGLRDILLTIRTVKGLDREIAADMLAREKEERCTAALRAIAENERQAGGRR